MARYSSELLLRIERVEGALAISNARAAPAPELHVRDLAGPVAVATLDRRNTLFNRCVGVGPDDAEQIAGIVAFYDALGVPPRIDVCPNLRPAALEQALRAQGLEPGGLPYFSRRVLIGKTSSPRTQSSGVSIEPLQLSDVETFIAIQESAWPVEGSAHERALAEVRATHALAGRYRYFACIESQKVAVAAMDLRDDVAYLNLAVTLEAYRRRGCHAALLRRRLSDASISGVQVAFVLTAPDSVSERNVRHAGFEFAYDRELWMRPRWAEHPFYRDAG